jgi:hypothetical protein
MTVEERFWIRVDQSAGSSACWPWTLGRRDAKGYGSVRFMGRTWVAHRLAWTLANGSVPAGLELDHLCRNRACCNPGHLELVTHAENMRRGRVHWVGPVSCPAGHSYDEANTYVHRGHRACKRCKVQRTREWRAQKAAAA